jgi:hypothetical protein
MVDCLVDRGKTFEWCFTKQHSETNTLFIHHSTLSHFIQTITKLNLSRNEIGAQGAQHLSDALRNNTVRYILSSFIIQLFLISYRHLHNSTSNTIKSEFKGRNIWVMLYETTQWDKYSLHPSLNSFLLHTDTHRTQPLLESNRSSRGATSEWCITKQHSKTNTPFIHHSTLSHFIQTLRQLNVEYNEIGAEGAQHLSDALGTNIVGHTLFIHHSTLSHFIQTLTQLSLRGNGIGDEGAQHLGDALRSYIVREILSSSIIQLFLISYRQSHNSTLDTMKSEMKGRNI